MRNFNPMPPQQLLHDLLIYDGRLGKFFWRKSPKYDIQAGSRARKPCHYSGGGSMNHNADSDARFTENLPIKKSGRTVGPVGLKR